MIHSQEMIAAMTLSEHRVKIQMIAEQLDVEIPHNSTPIKVIKGATTGVCMAGGLVLSGATAYTVGMLVSAMIPWDKIESKAVKLVLKGGTIGLGTVAGTAAGKAIYDMGDDINEIIDIMCDKALSKDISAVLADKNGVEAVMTFDNEDDGEPDRLEE